MRLPRLSPVALLVASLALAACASDDGMRVVLVPGTTATYSTEVTQSVAGRPDSLIYTATATQRVLADRQTVQGQRGLTEVAVDFTEGGRPLGTSRVWYRADDERLSDIAYADGVLLLPLRSATAVAFAAPSGTLPILLQRRLADHARVGGDSVTVRRTPRIVAQYPLEAGRTWLHFDLGDEGYDFRSTRTVLGQETVATPAGDRVCWQIRSVLAFAGAPEDTFDWVDCLDADGLVLRVFRSRFQGTTQTGDPIGEVVQTERTVRTGVTR